MYDVSFRLGGFVHKPTNKLCIVGNVMRDRKLATGNSKFLSHINNLKSNLCVSAARWALPNEGERHQRSLTANAN
jgi:hypothetical protein